MGMSLSGYGGSVITFKEFQIESALTLVAAGRPRYAYAAYARPCFRQVEQTDAVGFRQKAEEACKLALEAVPRFPDENRQQYITSPFWKACHSNDNLARDPLNSLPLLPTQNELQEMLARPELQP